MKESSWPEVADVKPLCSPHCRNDGGLAAFNARTFVLIGVQWLPTSVVNYAEWVNEDGTLVNIDCRYCDFIGPIQRVRWTHRLTSDAIPAGGGPAFLLPEDLQGVDGSLATALSAVHESLVTDGAQPPLYAEVLEARVAESDPSLGYHFLSVEDASSARHFAAVSADGGCATEPAFFDEATTVLRRLRSQLEPPPNGQTVIDEVNESLQPPVVPLALLPSLISGVPLASLLLPIDLVGRDFDEEIDYLIMRALLEYLGGRDVRLEHV